MITTAKKLNGQTSYNSAAQGHRACFISQRSYPTDQRLYTEITALQSAGYEVHVICTRDGRESFSIEDGIRIHRVPSLRRVRGSIIRYMVEYTTFFVSAFVAVTYLHLRSRFDLVHVTNMPDLLLLSAAIPRLMGAKLLFDVRECSPEMFADRLGIRMRSIPMKFVIGIEQWAIRYSHATVTCTEQMKQVMIRRGANPDKIFVILNVSLAHLPKAVLPDPCDTSARYGLRITTHGTIIKRYGHRHLIEAMPRVLKEIPGAHLEILGKGEYRPALERLVAKLGIAPHVTFAGFVPDGELVARLRKNHVGVVSLEQNPEAELVHTHKMFEYIALGIPVAISCTLAVRAYFDEDELAFYKPNDPRDLARVLVELGRAPARRYTQAARALNKMALYSGDIQRRTYLDQVHRLLTDAGPAKLKDPDHAPGRG